MYPGADSISDWLLYLEAAGRSPATVRTYRYALQAWGRWCWSRSRIVIEATQADATTWIAGMRRTQASDQYILSRMAAVTSFYAWAIQEGKASADPLARIPRPKLSRPAARALETSQLGDVLKGPWTRSTVGTRDRALLQLLYESGMRRGEASALEIQDLDLVNSRVEVRRGKGGRARTVFIGAGAVEWLARWKELREGFPAPHDRLFLDPGSMAPCDPDAITRIVRKYGDALDAKVRVYPSGVRRSSITPHAIRHTCATQMYLATGDMRTVQEHLGHSSMTTTERYVAANSSRVRDAVSKLPVLA